MITEKELNDARAFAESRMSQRRFSHTLGVERECCRLAKIYLPQHTEKLRFAALLHDITKECTKEEQAALCEKFGIPVTEEYRSNPKLFHALTGAYEAREKFKDVFDEEMFDAVRYHTTGRAGMSMSEKIIYFADYIEDTRTFPDCVKLREFFIGGLESARTEADKYLLLEKSLLLSFDMTIENLLAEKSEINCDTLNARNFIIRELKKAGPTSDKRL